MADIPLIETATGLVVNVIVLNNDSDWEPPAGYKLGPEGGRIGDKVNSDGKTYSPPPPPKPTVPPFITTLQLLRQMRAMKIESKYTEWTGNLSDPLKADWEEMVVVNRTDKLFVDALKAAFNWDDAKVDEIFIAAVKL